MYTWLGDHVTEKSLLKSPVEITEENETWKVFVMRSPMKTANLKVVDIVLAKMTGRGNVV